MKVLLVLFDLSLKNRTGVTVMYHERSTALSFFLHNFIQIHVPDLHLLRFAKVTDIVQIKTETLSLI